MQQQTVTPSSELPPGAPRSAARCTPGVPAGRGAVTHSQASGQPRSGRLAADARDPHDPGDSQWRPGRAPARVHYRARLPSGDDSAAVAISATPASSSGGLQERPRPQRRVQVTATAVRRVQEGAVRGLALAAGAQPASRAAGSAAHMRRRHPAPTFRPEHRTTRTVGDDFTAATNLRRQEAEHEPSQPRSST